ncbi:MAG: DUF4301 family protein [Bacteroidetes bacterium]|nr:DUF4301 family protein [Bacteroidota bacterium]
MLTPQDLLQVKEKGIDPVTIEKQLETFRKGYTPVRLSRAAITGDGILSFPEAERKNLVGYFNQHCNNQRIVKFVPASGAATRMFKHLFEFRQKYGTSSFGYEEYLKDQGFNSVYSIINNLEKFAFYEDLQKVIRAEGKDLPELIRNRDFNSIIDHLLTDRGLDYGNLPKALIRFHNYNEGARIAAEEHLVEAARYAKNGTGDANLHFTLSPEHMPKFKEKINEVLHGYETKFNVKFRISYSIQKPSTDTIAVDMDNEPFRLPSGTLLFRPAGHGALIENLNDIEADIIFVKNIDNIVPDPLKGTTVEYKKLLGGYLLMIRDRVFDFLRKSEAGSLPEKEIDTMVIFSIEKLLIEFPKDILSLPAEDKLKILRQKLNRPIRVCGMVKNEGEPGGGPFWVTQDDGSESLQIVESSQMDLTDESQKKIAETATHFNPVDLVCSTKDFRGNTFNLHDYVDESTGFISIKSSGDKNLKALELPGLWNGAMADWITVFVDVPIITFNPVKIINDLLRKEHQS